MPAKSIAAGRPPTVTVITSKGRGRSRIAAVLDGAVPVATLGLTAPAPVKNNVAFSPRDALVVGRGAEPAFTKMPGAAETAVMDPVAVCPLLLTTTLTGVPTATS